MDVATALMAAPVAVPPGPAVDAAPVMSVAIAVFNASLVRFFVYLFPHARLYKVSPAELRCVVAVMTIQVLLLLSTTSTLFPDRYRHFCMTLFRQMQMIPHRVSL